MPAARVETAVKLTTGQWVHLMEGQQAEPDALVVVEYPDLFVSVEPDELVDKPRKPRKKAGS